MGPVVVGFTTMFLAHLNRQADSILMLGRPSFFVCQPFSKIFSSENDRPNFMWSLLWKKKQKFV